MISYYHFRFLFFISIYCLSQVYCEVIVSTDIGKIRGIIEKSRDSINFYSFRGIRYAEAPKDSLRFEPPQEIKPWKDVYDATKDGKMCPQPSMDSKSSNLFSEDCLILNVYTKNLEDNKPVMVFIHGGSFVGGGSHSLGPKYFMDKDVVLVTVNYRLGLLGFITTGTKEAPGNLAFKDQVMALKWIKRHIHNFGGDPNLITLFGQSAGSNSVSLHLISPMSNGLFDRAILMSGTSTTRIPALNINSTKIIGEKCGCPIESGPSELIKCLRKVPYQQIIEAGDYLNEFGSNPIRKWNWVVEDDFGQERFLEEDANVLMQQGKFRRIPIMAGVTSKEFLQFGHEIVNRDDLLEEFNNHFEEVAPICLLYERNTKKSFEVSRKLKETYFKNRTISKDDLEELGQLFSDGILRSGFNRMIDRIRKYQNIYLYTNNYKGKYSFLYNENHKPYGIVHSDDLLYLFTNLYPAPLIRKEDPENLMVDRMINIWTKFAADGVPEDNRWIPTTDTTFYWHELSDNKSERTYFKYIPLWDELFPENKLDA